MSINSIEITAEQQEMVDEFTMVTEADSATAKAYLRKHQWEVVTAINDYFEWMHQHYSEQEQDNNPDSVKRQSKNQEKVDDDQRTSKKFKSDDAIDDQNSENDKLCLFRHVTYNIDSLNEKNLKIRVEAICRILLQEKATIVFLQEVIDESERIIRSKLSDYFEMFSGFENSTEYYTMTLVAKKPWIKIIGNNIVNFKQTMMGRNVLQVDIILYDAKLILLNTHLESTKEAESIRKQQLAFLFQLLESIDHNSSIILAGDLNTRDKELHEIGNLPVGVEDAWIATGCRKEVQYTWDMLRNDNLNYHQPKSNFKPRMRFDRVWFRRSKPVRMDLIHFGLIGLERLKPYVCFPSDHWGVSTSYQVYRNQN